MATHLLGSPEKLKNLILLTAPVSFPREEMGTYSLFTSQKNLDPDLLADALKAQGRWQEGGDKGAPKAGPKPVTASNGGTLGPRSER